MRLIGCLFLVVTSFSATHFAQKVTKPAVSKPMVLSKVRAAEVAWPSFWTKFKHAVEKKDRSLLKDLATRGVKHHDCCEDENGDGDIRDEFITSLDIQDGQGWDSIREVVRSSKRPGTVERIKDYVTGDVVISRTKGPPMSGGSQPWCRFIFDGKKWLLDDFAYTEV